MNKRQLERLAKAVEWVTFREEIYADKPGDIELIGRPIWFTRWRTREWAEDGTPMRDKYECGMLIFDRDYQVLEPLLKSKKITGYEINGEEMKELKPIVEHDAFHYGAEERPAEWSVGSRGTDYYIVPCETKDDFITLADDIRMAYDAIKNNYKKVRWWL